MSNLNDSITQFALDYISAKKRSGLRNALLKEIEPIVLQEVMKANRYNQSQACRVLGLARGTMRKKLIQHFGNKYNLNKEEQEELYEI